MNTAITVAVSSVVADLFWKSTKSVTKAKDYLAVDTFLFIAAKEESPDEIKLALIELEKALKEQGII